MVQVTELGYMGIGVKDLDEWKNFATKVVGLELADDGERDRCYLRMDYWHHRIVMHSDPSDDLHVSRLSRRRRRGIRRDAASAFRGRHQVSRRLRGRSDRAPCP